MKILLRLVAKTMGFQSAPRLDICFGQPDEAVDIGFFFEI